MAHLLKIGIIAMLFGGLVGCASTEGDNAPATQKTTVDTGGLFSIFSSITPRGCSTQVGIISYGFGQAGQPCQVFTNYGWQRGITVK